VKTYNVVSKNYVIVNGKDNPNLIDEFVVFKRVEKEEFPFISWDIVASRQTYKQCENYINDIYGG
jgi:hypothetical protein